MKASQIGSIGWLYGANHTIILTPCINSMHATKVRITREEFETIRGDKKLMMEKAAELLSQDTTH